MFILDGTTYDVDYSEFNYNSRTERKYEYISADGTIHGEKLGSYRSYTLSIGNRPSELIDEIAAQLDNDMSYHEIEIYDSGNATELRQFEILVDSIDKNIRTVDDSTGIITYHPLMVTFRTRKAVV